MSALPEPRPIEPDPEVDGEETSNAADKPREPTERELAMEQIAAQREQRFAEESGEPIVDSGQPDTPAKPAEAKALDQVAAQTEPVKIEDPANYMVKVKIDGQEMLVPLADVVRTHQKDTAATQRLAEATRLLDEAQQRTAEPAKTSPPAATQPAVPASEPEREFLNALYSGDEEKTTQALKTMLDGLKPATTAQSPINAEAIASAVEQRLTIRSALTKFRDTYGEIVNDPYLPRLADTFLMEETGNRPLEEFEAAQIPVLLEKAGKRTRDWIAQRAAAVPGAVPTTTRADKLSRKESIDEVPSVSLTAATNEPEIPTTSQVIADMAKARPGGHDL